MKNYTLVAQALNTAEELLNTCREQTEIEIKVKGSNALEQIADYIWHVLENADWVGFAVDASLRGCAAYCDTPLGELRVDCGNSYIDDGERYNGQLFIRSFTEVTRVYFNQYGYIIHGGNDRNNLLLLCYQWKTLKRVVDERIEQSFEKKQQQIQKQADRVKRDRQIVDSFEI